MATTTTRIVTRAMRKLGALPRGRQPSTTELADCKTELRGMLDTWRLEKLMVVANAIVNFDLDPAKRLYTYSSALNSDFVGERPVSILGASISDGTTQWPLDEMTVKEYALLNGQADAPGTPQRFCYFKTFPQAQIGLDCLPMEPSIRLIVQAPLVSLPAVDTEEFELAPGYEDAIFYNLAVRLAPDFEVELDQVTIAMAQSAKRLIKQANFELPEVSPRHPHQGGERFDINNFGPVVR